MKAMFIVMIMAGMLSAQKGKSPTTVDSVDIQKYAGLWYEIARIPNFFQDDCAKNTTAEYFLQEDGSLKVVNRCIEEDGEINEVEGIARIVDKKSNSKLEVSFVKILGIRLFWGDYWIIGLDNDYKWAVVGHPERKYGWILSRTKTLDEKTQNSIFELLKEQGYNPEDFKFSVQD